MKKTFLAAIAVAAVTSGCAKKEAPAAATNQPAVAHLSGQQIYAQNCSVCHGAIGAGDSPLGSAYPNTNLTDGDFVHGGSKSDVTESIARGIPGTPMRGFQGLLSPQEIDTVAEYVLSLNK